MKIIAMTAIFIKTIVAIGCTKQKENTPINDSQPGLVKGRVVDTKGNGISNAKVVIENTVFYAMYVHTITDAQGYFKTNVPEGSWHASVQIQKQFLDRVYSFELHPDVDDDFAGTAGAIRNFSWKLSGAKPRGNGFYGSDIAVYSEPGSEFTPADVALTLTPEGPLADGSTGLTIVKKLTDIGGGEDGVRDVPVGKYNISAYNNTTGKPLLIRIRNVGAYNNSVTGIFNSEFTDVNNYQIVVQIK